MSTSSTFKYRGPDKRSPFPFNRDNVSPSGYRTIPLTETAGDDGLAEACRLWWLLEDPAIEVTMSGSMTCLFGSFGVSGTLSPPSSDPLVDPYLRSSGSVWGTSIPTTAIGSFLESSSGTPSGIATSTGISATFTFHIAYEAGKWLLAYAAFGGIGAEYVPIFEGEPTPDGVYMSVFFHQGDAGDIPAEEESITTVVTFDFAGYTISILKVHYVYGYGITDEGSSSLSISASPTFYTLV